MSRRPFLGLAATLWIAAMALASPARACPDGSYNGAVPNAGCTTCHDGGSGTACCDPQAAGCDANACLNVFGRAFRDRLPNPDPAADSRCDPTGRNTTGVWNAWFAYQDSDGDGWLNGQELNDYAGDGTADAVARSAPGYASSEPGGYNPNACSTSIDDCVSNSSCSDGAEGGFGCSCLAGYQTTTSAHLYVGRPEGMPGQCSDVNECMSGAAMCGVGTCSNLAGNYTCLCDADEACVDLVSTTPLICHRCAAGCDPAVHDCWRTPTDDVTATCNPRAGDPPFTCMCPSGYRGDGRQSGTGCANIPECAEGDPCGIGAGRASACVDRTPHLDPEGDLYECTCNAGYRSDGTTCVDIDECGEDPTRCGPGVCLSSTPPAPPASWSCNCDMGYAPSAGATPVCQDIDECAMPSISLCSDNATCTNSIGSFSCTCNTGFSGDGRDCQDIDECMDGTAGCHAAARCENTFGSYRCLCEDGYRGSGFECVDIDECAEGTGGCAIQEVCVNQVGMPNLCECRTGYTRDGSGDCVVTCGDGMRGPGEECEDGNTAAGDGCSDRCVIEEGYVCFEQPSGLSMCSDSCGDGLIQSPEECDDGAANSDSAVDGCRANCRLAHCGDGVVDTGEGCDLAGANDDTAVDGCRTTCDEAYCGDGVVDTGERCDPGGGVPGAVVVGTCTTACSPDAGILADDPPILRGGTDAGCAVGSARSSRSPIAWLVGLALLGWLTRRRRSR